MSNAYKPFLERLKLGSYYECEFLKKFNIKNYIKNNTHTYDFMDKDTSIKYEIKSDFKAFQTKNIVIKDTTPTGLKDRGIHDTEADYIIIFVVKNNDMPDYDVYKIPKNKIIKYIDEKRYKRIFKNDGVRGGFYIFDMSIFEKYKI